MVNWLLVTVALVAAQGGLIYGFDSGKQQHIDKTSTLLTTASRHHRNDLRS